MPEARRTFAATRFALSIDGAPAVSLAQFEGGDAIGDVVSLVDPADPVVRKHVASVHYSPLELTVGSGASPALLAWVRDALAGDVTRRNVTVSAMDATAKEAWRIEGRDSAIADVNFPALDASSKDALHLAVSVVPEQVSGQRASGVKVNLGATTKAKAWLSSNFRLSIDGLDTSRVVKVAPFVARCRFPEDETGMVRPTHRGVQVEISNLVVTLSEAAADSWWTWQEEFLLKGSGEERSGRLELLAPNLAPALTLELRGVGMVSLLRSTAKSADEQAQLRAELYVEQVLLAL